ncbi:TNF receptor-associated factor 4-like [Montipora foliosa]|uniref:TNF receptor-associated factor 4-like n=1 Tax=Montipora foliosa TaxID=591990 RepID=UPI0035F12B13
MAEALANSSHGGYEDDFVDAVEEDLKCVICQFPLRDPILTKCGHRFCNKCLDTYFTRLEREGQRLQCPVDRGNLSRDKADVFPDKATERKILSFAVKCPSEGCQWTGELRSKSNHLESCPLKLISCTNQNCHEIMVRRDVQEHVNFTCRWRIVQCSYCHMAHPACKEKDHQAECGRYPVKCPQLCNGAAVPREEIEDHIKKECPLTMISCPYAEMGCTTKIQRREAQVHLESSIGRHLHLVCLKLKETQIQLKGTWQKWNETTKKLHNTEKELNETKRRLDKTEVKVGFLLSRQLQSGQLHTNVWKISEFDKEVRRLQLPTKKDDKLQSPPFFCHGYKFRLTLDTKPTTYVCEVVEGLEIAFVLMIGELDELLPWPFRNKVNISIIDQKSEVKDRMNIKRSFEASTEEDKKRLSRPLDNKKVCYLWQIPRFLLQSCIVNDSLFIQVDVSPSS